ncbi:MAG: hypothetical protein MI923_10095 [Phycisphaerales bacterium]|nr:hypothetical protein [Phycisphaerales bacterium]
MPGKTHSPSQGSSYLHRTLPTSISDRRRFRDSIKTLEKYRTCRAISQQASYD